MGTFRNQSSALLRKSASYQLRNIATNICLVSAPIVFCLILYVIQVLVDNLYLGTDDFKCGCRCTQCCYTGRSAIMDREFFYLSDPNTTYTINSQNINDVAPRCLSPIETNVGPCPADMGYECLQNDESDCGIQYSSATQAAFCNIPNPSSWPDVITVPRRERRYEDYAPDVTFLVTSDSPSKSQLLGDQLFNQLDLSLAKIVPLVDEVSGANGSFNGAYLSELGFKFASSEQSRGDYYVENAFLTYNRSYVMLPEGTCNEKNMSEYDPVSLLDFVAKYLGIPVSLLRPALDTADVTGLAAGFALVSVSCSDAKIWVQESAADVDQALFCGFWQARCEGYNRGTSSFGAAWDFANSAESGLNVTVQYNTTNTYYRGSPKPNLRIPTLVSQAAKAWWRTVNGTKDVVPPINLLGLMSMPKASSELDLDFSSQLGPLFYTWVVTLLMPTFLQQLVYEKERRLRMMMKMHGLGDLVYWTITYSWCMSVYIVYIAIFMIFGAVIGLNVFRMTNVGIQIIFYFLHGNCMIAFTFMLSSLFKAARTASVCAFIYVFGCGLIGQLLLDTFMDDDKQWLFFVEWVPAWALFRGLYEMAAYAFLGTYRGTTGMQFSNLRDSGNGMLAVWGIFIVEWFLFMLLAWYFEQILDSGNGIKRHPLFFMRLFWKKKTIEEGGVPSSGSNSATALPNTFADGRVCLPQPLHTFDDGTGSLNGPPSATAHATFTESTDGTSVKKADDDVSQKGVSPSHVEVLVSGQFTDVSAEAARVHRLHGDPSMSDAPIVIEGLRKVFPKVDGRPPKEAVREITMAVKRGECFGLLGPNGAGKTTLLSMLVGFLEPSAGTARVEGMDIRKEMNNIYSIMGVCPQHDLLWDQLTAREHLRFYGRLKGFTGKDLEEAVEVSLKSVNLFFGGNADKLACKFSGGMKRRLSVAISIIGSPGVVYLDEPSTGLDPNSRRNLWNVVLGNKAGRAMILTTHSMDEAEALCDRLGIFVDGQLVCIGDPKEITSRYGGYLVFQISVPLGQEQDAKAMVSKMCPTSELTYGVAGTLKYELPCKDITVTEVFNEVNKAKSTLDVLDWGVANVTLEEVFIKFARSIQAKGGDMA
eukprot:gene6110-2714_t